ncbi:MAG: acyl-CoA dehydrogenase family protein [Acidimicrobiia bacterium]
MDFDLDESQYLLQDTLKRYFANEYPLAKVREVFDAGGGVDPDLWRGLAELGLLGLVVPEEHGGSGFELLDVAVAAEVLGYSVAPGPFTEHVMATIALARGGTDAQKQRWLPGLASGELRATVALAEEGEGWLPHDWEMGSSATLSGTKDWVLHPEGADLIVVGTRRGLSLVDATSSGIAIEPLDGIDRTRRLATVTFDGVPHEPLDGGADVTRAVLDAGLVLLAADAFGAGLRVLELAVDYANTREQFGVTIGHFQALKHQIADVALEVHPSKGLYWYAAHAYDHVPEDATRFAALANAHITEIAANAGRRAVEVHGGIGYTWEADVHFFLKRAVLDRAYLGTPRALRALVAELNGWPVAS